MGPKYKFPSPIGIKNVVKKLWVPYKIFVIACAGCNALNTWKLNIFKIIDSRISFYCNNLDLLSPNLKYTFRKLKKGGQKFHRKFVFLAPAIKDANNGVVVWKMNYINTIKQEPHC